MTEKFERNSDGSPVLGALGNPKTTQQNELIALEARSLFDITTSYSDDRIDTIGIIFDKQMAIKFLKAATPAATKNLSEQIWFSYLEFEK